MAERIANVMDEKVLIVEKRNHIGGNVYDSYNEEGILIHNYGPHTFHTNKKQVFEYLCRFTDWHDHKHRVMSYVDGNFVPFPICLETINLLYNLNLSQEELLEFINSRKIPIDEVKTSEDVVLSQVGEDLYEKFFKNFTFKQWGVSPKELDKAVISRIPFRMNRDTRYFDDTYQGNPKHGYTHMCKNMLKSDNIKILLNTDYKEVIDDIEYERLIYTGPIDYYFNYAFGKLLYRSIELKFETYDMESYQPVASTRFPHDYDYTRITEFKKMTGQKHHKTTILKETPCFGDEPYYPYPAAEWMELYKKYEKEAEKEKRTVFLGRLAEYRYYNMDDVVYRALECFNKIRGDDGGN